MLHHGVGIVDGRLLHRGDQVGRRAKRSQLAVDQLDGQKGDDTRTRMRAVDHRVASSQHSDGIADDGLSRVRRRRDGANNAISGIFHQCQAAIAAAGFCRQVFGTRRFFCSQTVLDDLVFILTHAGLLGTHMGNPVQRLRLQNHFANAIDKGLPFFHGAEEILALRRSRRLNRLIHSGKDTIPQFRCFCIRNVNGDTGRRRLCMCRGNGPHGFRKHPGDDIGDHGIITRSTLLRAFPTAFGRAGYICLGTTGFAFHQGSGTRDWPP